MSVQEVFDRARWKVLWKPGAYEANDLVRDGLWLMIANTLTVDRAAPQPAGEPAWALPDSPAWLEPSDTESVKICGARFTPDEPSWYYGYRIWTVTGQTYLPYAKLGDELVFGTEFTANNTGWVEFPTGQKLLIDGTETEVGTYIWPGAAGTTNWSAQWDYKTQGGNPSSGEINHLSSGQLRVHRDDKDDNDQTSNLATVTSGTTINIGGAVYTIVDVNPQGNHYRFDVEPTSRTSEDLYTVAFEVPAPETIVHQELVGYWSGRQAVGIYSTTDLGDLVEGIDAYGVDLVTDQFMASPDWDTVMVGGIGGLSGGSDEHIGDTDNPHQVTAEQLMVRPSGANDHVAIQAAIDAKPGVVMLAPGLYDIGASINLASGTVLRGSGESTVLTLASGVNAPVVYGLSVSGVQVEDLAIDGNRAGQSTSDDHDGAGVSIRGVSENVFIRTLNVTNTASNGVYSADTISNLNVVDVTTTNTGSRGCHISADGAKVYGGHFSGTQNHDGVQVGDAASNVVVVGAYATNNTHKGFEVQVNSNNVQLIGCHAWNNGDSGIAIQHGSKGVQMIGCQILDNQFHGIHVDQTAGLASDYALISDCVVERNGDGTGECGIVIEDSSYVRVVGNHVADSARHNVQLHGASNCVVANNVCLNGSDHTGTSNGSGIQLEGTSSANTITGNICKDTEGTPTQKYGIEIVDGFNNILTGNYCTPNADGDISDGGTGTVHGDNYPTIARWRSWSGTQAEYDALGSYDPATLYAITDG